MTGFGLGIGYTKMYNVQILFASMNFKVRGKQKYNELMYYKVHTV